MQADNLQNINMRLSEDKRIMFPFEEYDIIGDTSVVDRMLNDSYQLIDIDWIDVASTLSRETTNYISSGSADGADSIISALNDAIGKLPIRVHDISNILFYIWKGKDRKDVYKELEYYIIECLPAPIDIIWGLSIDESLKGQQVKVALIAASK